MQAKGQSVKAGDVIPYVFCMGEDGTTAKSAKADRAHHPDELRKTGSTLKIGEGDESNVGAVYLWFLRPC